MKDTMRYRDAPFKKVVAQEVEKVYPQAVSQSPGYLPNIYAEAVVANLDSNRYQISWAGAHRLKARDKLHTFGYGGRKLYSDVLEVCSDSSVVVTFESPQQKVFVYGTEVADLCAVDYEALAMLNVSATQELARKTAALEVEVQRLKELSRSLAAATQRAAEVERGYADLAAQVKELQQMPGVKPRAAGAKTATR